MGYQTCFQLTIENDSPEIWHAITDHPYASMALDENGDMLDACKWYSHEEDMIAFSIQFPGAIFHLKGEGENAGDIWEKDFRNGQKQVRKAQIVIPPYDPTWGATTASPAPAGTNEKE